MQPLAPAAQYGGERSWAALAGAQSEAMAMLAGASSSRPLAVLSRSITRHHILTRLFLRCAVEKDIRPDDLFFHKYYSLQVLHASHCGTSGCFAGSCHPGRRTPVRALQFFAV